MYKVLLKKALGLAMVFLLALTIIGCKPQSSNDEEIVIGINYFPSALILLLAEDLGYYEEEGVNAKVVLYEDYSEYFGALETGEIDFTGLAFMDVFDSWTKGNKLKVIGVVDYSYGADAIVARQDGGIKDVKDLKGQEVAVEKGTIGEFLLDFAITQRGGLKETDITKINLSAKDASDAFINNEIDIAVSYEPFVYEMLSKSNGEVIFDSKNERGLIMDVFIVEESKLEARKDDYKKILKAWFRAVEYLNENPEKAHKIIGDRTGISPEEYEIQLESLYIMDLRDNITSFFLGAGFDSLYGSGRLIADFYRSNQLATDIPDIETMLDDSLIKSLYNKSN